MAQGSLGDIISYLSDLADNNNTGWFKENRSRYEDEFLAPAKQLVGEIGAQLKSIDKSLKAVPAINKSIKRLNRDLRFSKDKTPYNPRLHLLFWLGDKPKFSPAFHVYFKPDHFGFGCGLWEFSPAQLEAYRSACLDKRKVQALDKTLTAMVKAKGGKRSTPALKLPYGDTQEWNGEHLRFKNLVVMGEARLTKRLQQSGTAEAVIEKFATQKPVYEWVKKHIASK